MLRQIIIPDQNPYPLQLPDEYIGHVLELLAFQVDAEGITESDTRILAHERHSQKERLEKLLKFISKNPIKLPKGYKFNRSNLYE